MKNDDKFFVNTEDKKKADKLIQKGESFFMSPRIELKEKTIKIEGSIKMPKLEEPFETEESEG